MELRNFTGALARGESFVRAKADLVDTTDLSIHIKFTRAKGRDVAGYYRWNDRRMVLAVKQRLRYPRAAAYGVGTTPRDNRRLGGMPYRLVWHEESFATPDDLLVFVAGHEFWHYLCHSGQRKRDHETRANCHGFSWLREFRAWAGPGAAVAPIPVLPPRPDLAPEWAAAVAAASPAPAAAPFTPPSVPSVPFPHAAPPLAATPSLFAALREAATRPASPRSSRPVARPKTGAGGLLEAARQLLLFR